MGLKEECGLFGIWGHPDAAELARLGLFALQHRGQESAGIVTSHRGSLLCHKGMGLVTEVFPDSRDLALPGDRAIGHVRYSTTGTSLPINAQPFVVNYSRGSLAIAHNGNLTNAGALRARMESIGGIFQTTMDSEIIVHLMAKPSYERLDEALVGALEQIEGAYSLLVMNPDQIIAVRDPYGFRPLSIGRFNGGGRGSGAYVIASETCVFDLSGATFLRDVEPGEMVIFDESGMRSVQAFPPNPHLAQCIFEFIYFARPDSRVFGRSVHRIRKAHGRALAREHPVDADLVIAIPDTGNIAALGYAEESGIPFELGIVRNHYIGRTFIDPSQGVRDFNIKVKLNPIRGPLEGKRLVVVDDSIVRANTTRLRVQALRDAGAREIHLRISSPPITHPCYFGIDTPNQDELIASKRTVDEIRDFVEADSLGYLSLEAMVAACGHPEGKYSEKDFCVACFTSNYPIDCVENGRRQKHLFEGGCYLGEGGRPVKK